MDYRRIIEQNITTFNEFREYDDTLLMIEPIIGDDLLGFEEIGYKRYPKKVGLLEDCVQASLREMESKKPSLNAHPQNLIQYFQNKLELANNGLKFNLSNEIISRIPEYKTSNEINTNKLSLF